MVQVSIREAKAQLSRLGERARQGERAVIAIRVRQTLFERPSRRNPPRLSASPRRPARNDGGRGRPPT